MRGHQGSSRGAELHNHDDSARSTRKEGTTSVSEGEPRTTSTTPTHTQLLNNLHYSITILGCSIQRLQHRNHSSGTDAYLQGNRGLAHLTEKRGKGGKDKRLAEGTVLRELC